MSAYINSADVQDISKSQWSLVQTMWLIQWGTCTLCLLLTCLHHTGTKLTLLENNACELHNMPSDSTTVNMLKIFIFLFITQQTKANLQ